MDGVARDAQGHYLLPADGTTMFRAIAASADPSVANILHAEWVVGTITLRYTTDGNGTAKVIATGAGNQVLPADNGDAAQNAQANPTAAGHHHFVYWTVDIDPTWRWTESELTAEAMKAIAFKMNSDDIMMWVPATFTAHFAPNTYTIVFAGGTGSNGKSATGSMDSRTGAYGTAFVAPAGNAFELPGYTFGGWKSSEDSGRTIRAVFCQ